MEPHSHCHDVVTTLQAPSARMVRVDAMEQLPDETVCQRSPNELCWQVYAPPTRYMIVHRHGLFVCLQARPVDLLYLILSSATRRAREALLRRFAAVYHTTDYACMLLQIAAGAMNTGDITGSTDRFQRCATTTTLPANSSSSSTNTNMTAVPPPAPLTAAESTSASTSRGHDCCITAESLGARVECADSLDAARLARELLRDLAHPLCESETTPSPGVRQLSILLSPLANAVVLFTARALYGVWDVPAMRLSPMQLALHEAPLLALLRYLDSLDMHLRDDVATDSEAAARRVHVTPAAAGYAGGLRSSHDPTCRPPGQPQPCAWAAEETTRAGLCGSCYGGVGVQWQRGRMLLTLPMTASTSVVGGGLTTTTTTTTAAEELAQEQAAVHHSHREMLRRAYHVAWRAAQTMLLLRHTRYLPFPAEMRHVTVAQLIRDDEVALRLGRYVSLVLLGGGGGGNGFDRDGPLRRRRRRRSVGECGRGKS